MTTKNTMMDAHTQWANRPADQRFESMVELAAAVNARRQRSRSVDVNLSDIQVTTEGETILIGRGNGRSVEPSHWAFGQMAGWVSAPAQYIRQLPAPLAVQCLQHGVAKLGQERGQLKFMALTPTEDEKHGTLQAVTSPTYGRIWDADVVSAVQRLNDRTGNKFHNPLAYTPGRLGGATRPSGLYASDHDCFIFMIDGGSRLEAGDRAQLHRGFIVSNSETGARTFTLKTFLFNECCGNHIIWGAQDVRELSIRHTANGPYRFDSEAAPGLMAYANSSAARETEVIKRAQQYLLPEGKQDEVIDWLRAKGFTRTESAEAFAFAKSEEGDCRTLWHVVQGLTAYARGFDFIDTRVDLETRAGKLLEIVNN